MSADEIHGRSEWGRPADDLTPQLRTSLAHQLVVLADEVARTEAAAKEAQGLYRLAERKAQEAYNVAMAEADVATHEANKARKAARNKYNEVIQKLTPGVRVTIGGEP